MHLVVANPGAFGFTDVTDPCLVGANTVLPIPNQYSVLGRPASDDGRRSAILAGAVRQRRAGTFDVSDAGHGTGWIGGSVAEKDVGVSRPQRLQILRKATGRDAGGLVFAVSREAALVDLDRQHDLRASTQAAEEVADALHQAVLLIEQRLALGAFVALQMRARASTHAPRRSPRMLQGVMRTLGLLRMRLAFPESGKVYK